MCLVRGELVESFRFLGMVSGWVSSMVSPEFVIIISGVLVSIIINHFSRFFHDFFTIFTFFLSKISVSST